MTSPGYTFYWLQCNGLDERFNQTLQTMLAKLVRDKKEEWSDILDTCVFAYNTSRHESSKFTPFELMFNRKATIPIDIELRMEESEELAVTFPNMKEPDHQAREEERKKLLEEAKQNILCAQKKQKELYDKKHAKPHLYEPGQLVLKKDFTRSKRKGGKLDAKYLGPFTVKKALGNGTYLLSCCKKPDSTIQATGAHLKPYIPSCYPPADLNSCDPPTDTLDSSDPPIETRNSSDPPIDTLYSSDPPANTLNSSDPPIETRDSNDPPIDNIDSSDPPADKLLFDTLLFRLWRTGAFEEAYNSEEDGDVDVSHMHVHNMSAIKISMKGVVFFQGLHTLSRKKNCPEMTI